MSDEQTRGEFEVAANLPHHVNSFEYVRNHHYIRLKCKDGRETVLIPESLLRYYCEGCQFDMITSTNHGDLQCPICKTVMKSQWGREQVCFVPEKPSDFSLGK